MRMNRGTVLLLVISLIVIVVVLVLTIQQAAAPGDDAETISAEATPVALFPALTEDALVRLEVRDDLTGDRTVLLRASDGVWTLDPPDVSGGEVNQQQASGLVTALFGLQSDDSFQADDLAQYGLDHPAYSIYAVADDGAIHVMHVGNQNPAGSRYYAVVEQIAAGTTRPDLDLMQPLLERADVPTSLTESDSPLATAEATEAAEADAPASAESAEMAAEAETTPAVVDAAMTAEATSEATGEPVPEPLVTLAGPQTVYLVNTQTVRSLIAIIALPPVVVPTAQPTVDAMLPPELTPDMGAMEALPSGEATAEATEAPSAAEATEMAEATSAP